MKLFYSEAEDLIQKIENNLLILEENPENNKPIQELFYVYHTLKGLTAMVSLENLSKFIHHFETFLEKNKNLKEQIKNKDKIIDLLFKSLDVIRNTIEKIKKGEVKGIYEQELERINYSFEALDLRIWASSLIINKEKFTVVTLQDIQHEKWHAFLDRIFFHDILNTTNALQLTL